MKVLKKLYNAIGVLYNKIPPRARLFWVCIAILKYLVLAVILLNNTGIFTSCVSAEQMQNSAFVNWSKLRESHPAWKNFSVLHEEVNIINKKITNEKLSIKKKIETIKAAIPKMNNGKNSFSNNIELQQASNLLQKTTVLFAASSIDEMIMSIDKRFRKQVENQKRELELAFQAFVREIEEESNKRLKTKQQALEDELFEKIKTKEQKLKREFLEYQETVLKQSQNEKLNIQLQLIVAKSPDERSKLETRLNYLIGDEELLMQAKLEEHVSLVDSFKNEHNTKNLEILKQFNTELAKETKSRLYKREQELKESFAGFLKNNTSLSIITISALKNRLFQEGRENNFFKKGTQQTIKIDNQLQKFNKSAKLLPNSVRNINKHLEEERNAYTKVTGRLVFKLEIELKDKIKKLEVELISLKEQEKTLLGEIDRDITDHVNKISDSNNVTIVKKDADSTGSMLDMTKKVIESMQEKL